MSSVIVYSLFAAGLLALIVFIPRWNSRAKKRRHITDSLVFMYDQLNARQLALVQFLVDDGALTSQSAVKIAEVQTVEDVRKLLREKVDTATSEVGRNLNVRDFANGIDA